MLALVGCSSLSVSTDFDATKNFAAYTTYAWMPVPATTTQQGYNAGSLGETRIKAAVDAQMALKKIKLVTDNPDLLVAYHTGSQQQVEIDSYGYGWWGGGVDTYTYQEGTLIVDLVDPKAKTLVWRGTAQDALDDNPSGSELTESVNAAVAAMFAKYPPSTASTTKK
jgi:hypothetical protein